MNRKAFRERQSQLRWRAFIAKRGRVFWASSTKGTYDPFKKLEAKWGEWAAARKARNEARDRQLAISRGK